MGSNPVYLFKIFFTLLGTVRPVLHRSSSNCTACLPVCFAKANGNRMTFNCISFTYVVYIVCSASGLRVSLVACVAQMWFSSVWSCNRIMRFHEIFFILLVLNRKLVIFIFKGNFQWNRSTYHKGQLDLTSELFLTCCVVSATAIRARGTGVRGRPLFGRYINLTCIVDEGQI